MGNDAYTDVPIRKTPECGQRTWHGNGLSKQVSLRDSEPMDVFILLLERNAPLPKAICRLGRRANPGTDAKPLGNDGDEIHYKLPDAIQVDGEHELSFV